MTCVKNQSLDCLYYTTLLRVKSLQNFNFLTSILSHIINLCIQLYNRMEIDSDSDNTVKILERYNCPWCHCNGILGNICDTSATAGNTVIALPL